VTAPSLRCRLGRLPSSAGYSGVNAEELRTALWRGDLDAELPLLAGSGLSKARAHRTSSVLLNSDYYDSTLRLVLQDHRGSRLHCTHHSLTAGGATISPSRSRTRMAS